MTPEEFISKWEHSYPWEVSRKSMFIYDLRTVTGLGKAVCLEAARIESYDPALCIDRLCGNRPEEWRMKYEDLLERIKRIESILNVS